MQPEGKIMNARQIDGSKLWRLSNENEIRTHVEEEGPNRGFSLNGWKENLPKKRATQELDRLGQLFTYMEIRKTTTLATTNVGIIHGIHLRKGRNSSEG